MQLNDTSSTKSGLIQDIEDLLDMDDGHISGNTNRLNRFLRVINSWYRRGVTWIREVHGNWQYDDSNKTDLPIYTAD